MTLKRRVCATQDSPRKPAPNPAQIASGWRFPNRDSLTGIKPYTSKDATGSQQTNGRSKWNCREDIQVMI